MLCFCVLVQPIQAHKVLQHVRKLKDFYSVNTQIVPLLIAIMYNYTFRFFGGGKMVFVRAFVICICMH